MNLVTKLNKPRLNKLVCRFYS